MGTNNVPKDFAIFMGTFCPYNIYQNCTHSHKVLQTALFEQDSKRNPQSLVSHAL